MDAIPGQGRVDVHARYNMLFIWLICSVAALGGLLFGWDWVVISGQAVFEAFNAADRRNRDVTYREAARLCARTSLSGWANSVLLGCLARRWSPVG
jgi:hypothetical protein